MQAHVIPPHCLNLTQFNTRVSCYKLVQNTAFFEGFLSKLSSVVDENKTLRKWRLFCQLKLGPIQPPPHTDTHSDIISVLILPLSLLCVRQMRLWDNNGVLRHASES